MRAWGIVMITLGVGFALSTMLFTQIWRRVLYPAVADIRKTSSVDDVSETICGQIALTGGWQRTVTGQAFMLGSSTCCPPDPRYMRLILH